MTPTRDSAPPLRCPVCRAAFRAMADCPRCGADLRPLMTIAALAHAARQAARQAWLQGDFQTARAWTTRAIELHETPDGHNLKRLVQWTEILSPQTLSDPATHPSEHSSNKGPLSAGRSRRTPGD